MIRVLYGPKGTGKTKSLISSANNRAKESKGVVVFIDDSTNLMYDLKHEIRFVNVSEYPRLNNDGFFGFLCGILSQNYDIEGIYIDRLNFITNEKIQDFEAFFEKLGKLAQMHDTEFFITFNGPEDEMPDFMKKYAE
jgi:thymidine kinase